MQSLNKVSLIGNLGANPDIKTFNDGGKIAVVSVATSERWTDKRTGEPKEHTEWHRVVFNGKLADIAGQYLKKGSSVYVEGSLYTRKWTDQQGIERYTTEIRVSELIMLGGSNNKFNNDNGGDTHQVGNWGDF